MTRMTLTIAAVEMDIPLYEMRLIAHVSTRPHTHFLALIEIYIFGIFG